jgi:hypothetical protein
MDARIKLGKGELQARLPASRRDAGRQHAPWRKALVYQVSSGRISGHSAAGVVKDASGTSSA